MKKLTLLLILSFFSTQGFTAAYPDGGEPTKSISADKSHFVYNCGNSNSEQTSSSTVNNSVKPITFSNIKSRVQDIPGVAWQNTQNLINSNNTVSGSLVQLEILKGPNTKLYFEDNEAAFTTGIKLWKNFKQPKKYLALFYSFEDKSWAISKYNKPRLIEAPCTPSECTGANSGIIDYSDQGVGVFGINSLDAWDNYRYGPIQIHEYTHAVQMSPWIGKDHPGNEQQKISPCWLIEGQAHFAGISASFLSFKEYKETRNQQIKSHRVESFTTFSADKILGYYNNDIPIQCLKSPNYKLGYTLGFITVEVLSAIGGIESSMKIYDLAGAGQSFDQAFNNVYGISWNDAKPILAEVVALLHKNL